MAARKKVKAENVTRALDDLQQNEDERGSYGRF
jgi:hypothetical protein